MHIDLKKFLNKCYCGQWDFNEKLLNMDWKIGTNIFIALSYSSSNEKDSAQMDMIFKHDPAYRHVSLYMKTLLLMVSQLDPGSNLVNVRALGGEGVLLKWQDPKNWILPA